MKKLAKNTTYVVVIHKGFDSYNMYSKVVNAYKITNAKRDYFPIDTERVRPHTSATQEARDYLTRLGFELPYYLSDAQNLVVVEHEVKYKSLKD